MAVKTKVPQLPAVPGKIAPELRRFLEGVKQVVEVREGTRGKSLDQAVTFRDLVDADVDISSLHIPGAPAGDSADSSAGAATVGSGLGSVIPSMAVPPRPTGFRAVGGFEVIFLEWDNPREVFSNYGATQVFRNSENNLATAVMIGVTSSTSYFDRVEPNTGYYYWIRFITNGSPPVPGPFIGPVNAASALDPELVLQELSGRIDESHLANQLGSRIDLVDGDGVGSVTDRISQVSAGIEGNFLAIEEAMVAVNAMEGYYTLRIDADGYVAGFGLSVEPNPAMPTTQTSYFVIRADNFAIAPPSMAGYAEKDPVYPFTVGQVTDAEGNSKWVVAMDGATIIDASITKAAIKEAQIGNTHIDEKGLSSNHITTGTIRADEEIQVGNSHFVLRTVGNLGQEYILDTRGIDRVTLGYLGTNNEEEEPDYGIMIKNAAGVPLFDASGDIVNISSAAIDNLLVGGFKLTVPDSSYDEPMMHAPLLGYYHREEPDTYTFSQDPIAVAALAYDPQGCANVSVHGSFDFAAYGTWDTPVHSLTGNATPAMYTIFMVEVKASSSYHDYGGTLLYRNAAAMMFENTFYHPYANSYVESYYPVATLKKDSVSFDFLTQLLPDNSMSYINVFLTAYGVTSGLQATIDMARMKAEHTTESSWSYVWGRSIIALGTRG